MTRSVPIGNGRYRKPKPPPIDPAIAAAAAAARAAAAEAVAAAVAAAAKAEKDRKLAAKEIRRQAWHKRAAEVIRMVETGLTEADAEAAYDATLPKPLVSRSPSPRRFSFCEEGI